MFAGAMHGSKNEFESQLHVYTKDLGFGPARF